MINLRLRTEYSFNLVYGPIPKVIASVGAERAFGIADRHDPFYDAVPMTGGDVECDFILEADR